MCVVYTCLSGCMCWGGSVIYVFGDQRSASMFSITFYLFFFALLLEISYTCTVNYIYCFPFHSLLIITKCSLCNFMGLSLLSFYFASPLSPVSAVHVYRGEDPFPGRWESTNGQSNKKDSLSLAANPCPQLLAGDGGRLESISSIQSRMLVKLSLCRVFMSATTVAVCSQKTPLSTLLSTLHLLHPSCLLLQTHPGGVRKLIQMTSSGPNPHLLFSVLWPAIHPPLALS